MWTHWGWRLPDGDENASVGLRGACRGVAAWTSVARGATELVVSEGPEMLGVVSAFGEGVGYRGLDWGLENLEALSAEDLVEVVDELARAVTNEGSGGST